MTASLPPEARTDRSLPSAQRLLGGRAAPVLALLAGAATPLAFAPVGWAWLAVLCPALLFAIAAVAPHRTALWAGWLYGLGFYGVGVSWVYISIGRYGASGPLLAVLFTVALAAALALFFWLAVYGARRLRSGDDFLTLALAFPALWLLLEWVRTWFLTGFPWLLLGYSQTDTPLAGLAPLVGVLGISAVLVSLAGLLAWTLLRPSLRRLALFAAAATLALGGGALAGRVEWTEPSGRPLSVALLQGNIAQDLKWSPEWRDRTLERYWALNARHWGADIIVWPEAAVPTWYHEVAANYLADLAAIGAERGSELIIGIPYFDPASYRAYNSIISVGREPGVYHKRHLVPFGEYVPLRDLLGRALDILGAPMSDFAAGVEVRPLRAAGHLIGASICYEAVFGPEIAEALPAAELLVNISNDAWFGDSLAPHQHLQMVRMRALETGRDVMRATNTGITAMIDHRGRIVARAPQFEESTLATQAQPRRGATPYVRWLDGPVLGLLALTLAALAWRRAREARRRG